MVFLVTIHFVHIQRKGKHGSKGPCRIVIFKRGGKRYPIYRNRNISFHKCALVIVIVILVIFIVAFFIITFVFI